MTDVVPADAEFLHGRALVWDMVWPWEPWCGNDLGKLERMHSAGHNVVSITVAGDNHTVGEAVQRVAGIKAELAAQSQIVSLCKSVAEIDAALAEGKLAVLLHFEGTRCFERNLDMVSVFHELGVGMTLLAFNQTNSVAGGCMEETDGGLTLFGRSFVAEMARVGMLIDLSHCGHRTSLQVMEHAGAPCMFTHSNAAALVQHPRNISDAEVTACAATGGVVGISGSSMYLGDPACEPESLFRHLDHFVGLVGPDHVGLGIDSVFEPDPLSAFMRARPDEWPEAREPDWQGVKMALPEDLVALTARMLSAGYGEPAIRAILGGNWRRVCKQAWG
jgi:membrane dipeptidase